MKKTIKMTVRLISLILLTAALLSILAACGDSKPVADGNLYPVGNGYLRFFTYKQQDSVVALAFYVEDKHFTQEEYLDFLDNVVVDGCDRMGYTSDSEFDDEGYNPTDGQKNLIYAFYNIPDDVTFTSDSIHLPKLVKATEAAE